MHSSLEIIFDWLLFLKGDVNNYMLNSNILNNKIQRIPINKNNYKLVEELLIDSK